MAYRDEPLLLNVSVSGLNISSFMIETFSEYTVDELKEDLCERLLDMRQDDVQLFMVAYLHLNQWFPLDNPVERILHPEKVRNLGTIDLVWEMEGDKALYEYWYQQPPKSRIHIDVEVPYHDRVHYWLRLLCKRYWGRSDLKDTLYHQRSMGVPHYESTDSETPVGTSSVDYTLLRLGSEFKGFICDGTEALIRQEYIDLLHAFKERRARGPYQIATVVIGRPGIGQYRTVLRYQGFSTPSESSGVGKGTFLHHVLIDRVLDAKSTFFQNAASHFYYLSGANPDQVTWSTWMVDLPDKSWALVDSDAVGRHPHSHIISADIAVPFVLQVSGPKLERWKEWIKQLCGRCQAMSSLTWNDFYILNHIIHPLVDDKSLRIIYVKFGGSLHVSRMLSSSSGPEAVARFERQVEHALDARLGNILSLAIDKSSTAQVDLEYSIFTIEPRMERLPEVQIVSDYIESMICATLSRKEESNLQKLFEYLYGWADPSWNPSLHRSLCRIWEQLCLSAFTRPIHNTFSFRAKPADENGTEIDISLPQKLITYSHDKLSDTLFDHSSIQFGPDFKQSILMKPTGQAQPTFHFLEVSSSYIRLYQTDTAAGFVVDRDSLNDIWDAIQAAADRSSGGVKARFEALLPDRANGDSFKIIFVLPKSRFDWYDWQNRLRNYGGQPQDGWRYAIQCYAVAPIIGEV